MTATAWTILLVAGLFEAAWAIGLVYTDGFSELRASVATLVALAISMVLLARAVQELPVGTAYAVWTGIGAALTAVLGIYLFDESARPLRLMFLGVIVMGIAGLHATST
ncbi:DMT family transporter [Halobacteriales archaeon Cl-PHB]